MQFITDIIEDVIRRISFRLGWEVRDKIENLVWAVVLIVILVCCCLFGVLAVAYKIIFPS
jgi:hypothetical protein